MKPAQIVPRRSIHDLICLFSFIPAFIFSVSSSLSACSYQTQVILPSALQQHKERLCSIAMKLKPEKEKHFALQGPAEVHYLGGWCIHRGLRPGYESVSFCEVWWRHVGILLVYRAGVVSLAMVRQGKRSVASFHQPEMLQIYIYKTYKKVCNITDWLLLLWSYFILLAELLSLFVQDNLTIKSIQFDFHSSTLTSKLK